MNKPNQGLRARCLAFYRKQGTDAMAIQPVSFQELPAGTQNDPVEELVSFVVSEIGRAASEKIQSQEQFLTLVVQLALTTVPDVLKYEKVTVVTVGIGGI